MAKLKIEDLEKISQRVRKTTLLREGAGKAKIIVHMGTCGIAAGAREIMNALLDEFEKKNIDDRHRPFGDRGMGGERPAVPLVRHLAAHHQHRHDHRHLPHGLPDPEHAEPRQRGAPPQARRADPRHQASAQLLIDLEDCTEEEIKQLHEEFARLAERKRIKQAMKAGSQP